MAAVTLICVAGSIWAPPGAAKILALAPLAFVLLGQGFIAYRQQANRGRHRQEQDAWRSAQDLKLRGISKDYLLNAETPDRPAAFKESFLTHDRERNTLVRIDVGFQSEISAYAVGKIDGDVLDTFEALAASETYYRRYVDPEGRSIFDRYRVRHRPGQDVKEYRLERYEP